MSIFSSIGRGISNAYNTVSRWLGGGSKQTNAGTIYNGLDYSQNNRNLGLVTGTKPSMGASGSWTVTPTAPKTVSAGGGGNMLQNVMSQVNLPVAINAGQQSMSRASGGSYSSPSSFGMTSYTPETTTISAKNLGLASPTMGASGASLSSNISSPISLPNSPSSVNPGGIDNTKLAGVTAGSFTLDSKGNLIPVAENKQPETDLQTAKKQKELWDMMGYKPKDNVFEDPQVVEARNRRQQIQQALLAPTSELNAVISKQQTDLLAHRKMVSEGGGTETGFGGIESAINYNAAIRALPLQASIASLQGDLKLAQDYLSELTQVKQEQINNQYEYNKGLMASISGAIDKKDQRAYEEMKTANENARKEALDLEDFKAKLALTAQSNGGANVISRIHNAKDKMSAIQAAGQYGATPNTQIVQLDNGKTVVVDKGSGRIVSDLGGQKTATTYNLEGLTPEQASDPFIKKMAATAGGKPITDAFAQKLNKGLTVLDQIGGLQTNIKNVKTGPILGLFKGANPWDTSAQTIKAQLNAIVPNLARGVFGEVGVLTDNDIAQYSKTLPNLKSTEDIRNAVLGITVDLIGKSIKQTLEVNAANQKDVSGFIDIYTEMQKTRDSIFSQIPGYKGNTSTKTSNIDYTSTLDNIFK